MSDLDDMGQDKVWLVGPDPNDGRIVSRMVLPDDAERIAKTIDGVILSKTFGIKEAEPRMYEVFITVAGD